MPERTDLATRQEATGGSSPQPRPRRLLLTSYVLGGVALASLVTGIVVGSLGKKKLDELRREHCKPDCPQHEVDAGLHKYYAANAMFALGGALAVAAAVTLTLGWRASTKRDRPAAAEVGLDRHGLTLGLRATF